ncbi:MAG: hypothetical protein IJH76_00995 [Clostridia bacterium]|nr:hypothetical protein [Clostridia bacterium]
MFNMIYNFIFIIASILILIKAIAYGLYEIKNENNKSGGITIICFSVLVTIFVNIVVFFRH